MLKDPKEIEIISKARQANVRDPKRSREHFERIFTDFFSHVDMAGKCFLDLGPGQYDFGELVKERGGKTVCIDNDPAVLELGRYKGYEVIEGNLKALPSLKLDRKFDGVFCKFSINAFWFHGNLKKLENHCEYILNLLKNDGWLWVVPWNGLPTKEPLSDEKVKTVLDVQTGVFKRGGCQVAELERKMADYYGVGGETVNVPVFMKNLKPPTVLF